ncbi:MAG: recombinational DNA repair protein (RecE pathway), partial [Bacteroidales bacterium]|nr:recombinational DNA repair protein (RecE pathway) [Bacteroidales bacterium]
KTQDKTTGQNQLTKQPETASVRFTNLVMKEFNSGVGEIALTEFQKRLAQNYFIGIDMALQAAETKRLAKKKNQDPLPVVWQNVNMQKLARDVVAYARIGLDPAQKNHINMMPFKNNNTDKYDIVFIEGYRGLELKAVKYGLDVPDDVVVELIYSTDRFKVIKKDIRNKIESYELDVIKPFDRGTIIGGFYYHSFSQNPEKNKVVVFTLKDIEKRKPKYASTEFWGGEKDIWENGKVVGKEQVEGWYEKMCYKTIYRAAYSDITIDSQKIDDDYLRIKQIEKENAESLVEAEIEENANKEIIDIEPDYVVVDEPEANTEPTPEPEGQVSMEGPGY